MTLQDAIRALEESGISTPELAERLKEGEPIDGQVVDPGLGPERTVSLG